MDFCIIDVDDNVKDTDDEILRPFLKNISEINDLLRLPEYNDDFIKKLLSAKLYPIHQIKEYSIDINDKKVR